METPRPPRGVLLPINPLVFEKSIGIFSIVPWRVRYLHNVMKRSGQTRRTTMSARAARCEQILTNVPDAIWLLMSYLIIGVVIESAFCTFMPIEGETHPWAWLGFTNIRVDVIQERECANMDVRIVQKLYWSPRGWKYIRSAWLFDLFSTVPPEQDVCACAYFLLHMDPSGFAQRSDPRYNLHATYTAPGDFVMSITKYSRAVDNYSSNPRCEAPWKYSSVTYTRRNNALFQKGNDVLFSS